MPILGKTMLKIYNDKNEEFIYCTPVENENYQMLMKAFVFCITTPMNLLWASEKNKIMVNGRNRPFANLSIVRDNKDCFFYKWTMVYPVYSINEITRILKLDFQMNIMIPPMPIECWKFYKSYSHKLILDKAENEI